MGAIPGRLRTPIATRSRECRAKVAPGASARLRDRWFNRWGVFGATCLAYGFLNLSTFPSLGVVLYRMVKDLHWSMTAAGFNFSLLGISCGLTSPLAGWGMRRLGSRVTIALGAGLLLLGFLLASASVNLWQFYMAMVLLGVGYSFAGTVPAVYLITGWFGPLSARFIGFYYMLGALGAAIGPLLAEVTIKLGGGWRGHWLITAIFAAAVGVVCLALIRDKGRTTAAAGSAFSDPSDAMANAEGPATPEWTLRRAILSSQFLIVTISQTLTMASVTTNSSIAVIHLVKHGLTPTAGAIVLSVIALTATLVKGVAGRICEGVKPSRVLATGLVLQGVGNLVLLLASGAVFPYAAGAILGVGWGFSYVAGTVVLLKYFGHETGSQVLSFVWFLVTFAAAGPLAAGILADRYHSFSAIFELYAVIFLAVSVPIFLMRSPKVPDLSTR